MSRVYLRKDADQYCHSRCDQKHAQDLIQERRRRVRGHFRDTTNQESYLGPAQCPNREMQQDPNFSLSRASDSNVIIPLDYQDSVYADASRYVSRGEFVGDGEVVWAGKCAGMLRAFKDPSVAIGIIFSFI